MYYIYKGLEHTLREKFLDELLGAENNAILRSNPTREPEVIVDDGHKKPDENTVSLFPETTPRANEDVDGIKMTGRLYPEIPPNEEEVIVGDKTASAPPLNTLKEVGESDLYSSGANFNWEGYNIPPPPYEEAGGHSNVNSNAYDILGPNDLEWHQVFSAFNEKRMFMALQWTPPPVSGRPLQRCIAEVDEFLNSQSHPVSAQCIFKFLKSFTSLTNLVYAKTSAGKQINVNDAAQNGKLNNNNNNNDDNGEEHDAYSHTNLNELFIKSFSLLMNEYVPKVSIEDRKVPFGYDWFIFSGRITYAVINAHITLCSAADRSLSVRPYYTDNTYVNTNSVVTGLKNICKNFTESLGYERYSSNRVYIGTAFLYACLLEKACDRLVESSSKPVGIAGLLPDYKETLDSILTEPTNRYIAFRTLIDDIGKTEIPPAPTGVYEESQKGGKNKNQPSGSARGDVTYDGVYDDRTFFAHRRLRMYAYIHSYCEQLPSVQLLLREKQLDDEKLAFLLRAVEPMCDDGSLYYFNLHSRTGAFKYRNGSALFTAFGLSEFKHHDTVTAYGRVFVADKARILFVQSGAFTFHAIGQLSDLAFGEVETSNRDLMPAWLMGQRPLFRSEKNKLVDVPCGSHLEPCVVDTGKSEGLKMDPIKRRNTTDYTPTEASSAVVAFEENGIGAVFTSVSEINMDVRYSRCTVATPYYIFTTYFRITRCDDDTGDRKPVRLSCFTGCSEKPSRDNNNNNNDDDDDDGDDDEDDDGIKQFEFKHCTLRLFVQTAADGKDYDGTAVTVEKQQGVVKRQKSKSKYKSEELENVSLVLKPFGHTINTDLPGSVTLLYRPKGSTSYPLPKSYESRKISPRVTLDAKSGAYRVQVDSRYILYCDIKGNSIALLDIVERRACVSPIRFKLQDDRDELNVRDLLERTSLIVNMDISGPLIHDSAYCNRIYAYF